MKHVVEQRVKLVLECADDALERHHLLADDHDPGPDHAGEVAARARRYAPAHRTVERRVLQYVRAADAGHDDRGHGRHEAQARPVHDDRGAGASGLSGTFPVPVLRVPPRADDQPSRTILRQCPFLSRGTVTVYTRYDGRRYLLLLSRFTDPPRARLSCSF